MMAAVSSLQPYVLSHTFQNISLFRPILYLPALTLSQQLSPYTSSSLRHSHFSSKLQASQFPSSRRTNRRASLSTSKTNISQTKGSKIPQKELLKAQKLEKQEPKTHITSENNLDNTHLSKDSGDNIKSVFFRRRYLNDPRFKNIALSTQSQNSSESTSNAPPPPTLYASGPLFSKLFVLPLYRKPAFPGFYQILQIQDQNVFDFLLDLKKNHGHNHVGGFFVRREVEELFGNENLSQNPDSPPSVATLRKDAGKIDSLEDIHTVGSVLHLLNFIPHSHINGGQVVVMPHKRIRITDEIHYTPIHNQKDTKKAPEDTGEIIDTKGSKNIIEKVKEVDEKNILEVVDETTLITLDSKLENEKQKSSNEASPLFSVQVEYIKDQLTRFDANDVHKALHLEIISTMKDLLKTSFFYKEHFDQVIQFYNLDYPHKLADLVAGMSLAKGDELQAVLEEFDIGKRLQLVLKIAKKDLEFAKLQVKVKNSVEKKASKEQRRYILMEQLKFIKRELGIEKDDKQSILQTFEEKLNSFKQHLQPEQFKTIQNELDRFSSLDPMSSEYNVCRTYLEWLTNIPWGQYTKDSNDINEAERVLNEDHYGLNDVKDRILELMAVNVLKEDTQGKIICLVGPPGVGKTSIGKSIARSLGRKFYQFSLGGLSDVAELHGHRRTYVGSMPGKLIQALKHTQSSNPVILLDEIDKLGRDMRGDPASALLEILDPSQNSTFRDHYLDLPIDLSKVLFVCTANTPDTIPGPLLDRLEIIRIAGYIFEEKLTIANQYLIPQTKESTGVKDDQLLIETDVLPKLVRDYSREAGVRNLLKLIEKIYRKAALQIVRGTEPPINVALENLTKFVGQPYFHSERLFEDTPPGVVMGLAWTQMGGATLYIEATGRMIDNDDTNDSGEKKQKDLFSGTLKVTGQLGSVMNESSQIALTFSRNFLPKIDPKNHFLDQAHIHLHVPEGATPKDGPSAGITMATSLISLATNMPVKRNVAMTGELTLTGKILKIGGLKEKVIAAKRENANFLVFPYNNQRDFEELDDQIKAGLDVHFAENYDQVYQLVFDHPK